jgi:hypothetical protein
MTDAVALYKADWMRVLADVGLGAAAISRAIELAELNGLFDPVKAVVVVKERKRRPFVIEEDDYCGQCGGPCLRRPRHGEAWA